LLGADRPEHANKIFLTTKLPLNVSKIKKPSWGFLHYHGTTIRGGRGDPQYSGFTRMIAGCLRPVDAKIAVGKAKGASHGSSGSGVGLALLEHPAEEVRLTQTPSPQSTTRNGVQESWAADKGST